MPSYKIRLGIAVSYLFLVVNLHAQTKKLAVGDTLPELVLKDVLNYSKPELRLSGLRGKYLILDFWNHNCHYCLASFKNLDSLQKQFAGTLQIVLVNKEDKAFTEKFFKTKKQIHPPNVPLATGGAGLIDLFPKEGYPYSVWVDKQGIIRQMTLAHNITTNRLRDFVSDKPLQLNNATRKIFYGPLFNYKSDSLENKIGYFSCITRYIDDLNIGFAELSRYNHSLAQISSSAASIVELYKKAYREGDRYNFNQEGSVVLKVKDPALFVRPEDPDLKDAWEKEHSYNYSLFLPVQRHKEAYKIMQEDLHRYFGLKVSVVANKEHEKPYPVLVLEE